MGLQKIANSVFGTRRILRHEPNKKLMEMSKLQLVQLINGLKGSYINLRDRYADKCLELDYAKRKRELK